MAKTNWYPWYLFFALIVFALPTQNYAGPFDPTVVTAAGGCKVWADYDPQKRLISWTGKCDEQGYATGDGTRSLKSGFVDVFIGEMRAGKMFAGSYFQNAGGPGCMPTPNSGQMTNGQLESAGRAGPCKNRSHQWWVEKQVVSEGHMWEKDSMFYFGPDAQRIVDQTGNAALSALLRSMAPKRFRAPRSPVISHAPKPTGDACAKIVIVNGKKLCEE